MNCHNLLKYTLVYIIIMYRLHNFSNLHLTIYPHIIYLDQFLGKQKYVKNSLKMYWHIYKNSVHIKLYHSYGWILVAAYIPLFCHVCLLVAFYLWEIANTFKFFLKLKYSLFCGCFVCFDEGASMGNRRVNYLLYTNLK